MRFAFSIALAVVMLMARTISFSARLLAGKDDVLLWIRCWTGLVGETPALIMDAARGDFGAKGDDGEVNAEGEVGDEGEGDGDKDANAKGSLPLDKHENEPAVPVIAGTVECLLWLTEEPVFFLLLLLLYMKTVSVDTVGCCCLDEDEDEDEEEDKDVDK